MARQEEIPLTTQLVQASYNAYSATTDLVIDGLRKSLAERTAEVACIRNGINGLLNERFMPTSDEIRRVLYPSQAAIEQFIPKEEGE